MKPHHQPQGSTTLDDLLRALPDALNSSPETRQLVVIADRPRQVARLGLADSAWSRASALELIAADVSAMHDALSRLPRVDLIIDVRRSIGAAQFQAWRELFFHVNAGGAWMAMRSGEAPEGKDERLVRRLTTLPTDTNALAQATDDVTITERFALTVQGTQHVLKVADAGSPALLATREPELTVEVLGRRDAGTFTPAGTTTSYVHDPGFDDKIPYPAAEVRRYTGRITLPRTTLVHSGRSALPDSFRWHLSENPKVSGLTDVRDRFGILEPTEKPTHLEGSYYHFGYNHPGHFGHLMTEAVSRLWGWAEAKAADPELKILCRLHPNPKRFRPAAQRLETVLLPAFGIAPDDIVWAHEPVTVDSLVGVTPLWHNTEPYYVHPAIHEVWSRLRAGLADATANSPDRIFVTRPARGNRHCRNAAEVEQAFAERGFTIVEPSERTVAEQATLFAHASVIAGFGGSAMFNMVYSQRVKEVIVLNHTAYIARNEHLFASAFNANSHFFWSVPEQDHPEDGFSQRSFQSAWSFDFARNGDALFGLLDGLIE